MVGIRVQGGVGDVERVVPRSGEERHGIRRQRQGQVAQRQAGIVRVIELDDSRAVRAHVGGGKPQLRVGTGQVRMARQTGNDSCTAAHVNGAQLAAVQSAQVDVPGDAGDGNAPGSQSRRIGERPRGEGYFPGDGLPGQVQRSSFHLIGPGSGVCGFEGQVVRGADCAVVSDVQRGVLVPVEPEGGTCVHGQGGDGISQGFVQREIRIPGNLYFVKILERSQEAGGVVVKDELLLPVHRPGSLAVDDAGVFVELMFGSGSGSGGDIFQGDRGASVDGAAGFIASAQKCPRPVIPVSLAQNGVRARDGQAGSPGNGAVRLVPGVNFIHERSAIDEKGGGAGDGFISRVKAAENAVGEYAVIEHHGDVPVHGGGIGSRHGGAVRFSGGEGSIVNPGG